MREIPELTLKYQNKGKSVTLLSLDQHHLSVYKIYKKNVMFYMHINHILYIIIKLKFQNVKAATRRINIIVVSSRMKQRATHFLSIPMNVGDIARNYEIFKVKVSNI